MRGSHIFLILLFLLAATASPEVCAPAPGLAVELDAGLVTIARTAESQTLDEDAIVRCDTPGFEPLDVSVNDETALPATFALSSIAREIFVEATDVESVVVEWYDVKGGEPRRLASREWNLSEAIPVAAGSRVLRVLHPERGSFSFAPDRRERVAAVWSPREAIALFPSDSIYPAGLRIGDRVSEVATHAGFSAAFIPLQKEVRGIAVRPVYTGGIEGKPAAVEPSEDGSIWIGLDDFPPVGGVDILTGELLCSDVEERTLVVRQSGGVLQMPFFQASFLPDCSLRLDGLPPAALTFAVAEGERTLASADVTVDAGIRTTASLRKHAVEVWGKVEASGRPIEGLIVVAGYDQTTTGSDGSFRMDLTDEGEQEFELFEPLRIPVHSVTRELTRGLNMVEIELPGTILEVTIYARETTPDPAKGLQIMMRTEGPNGRGGFVFPTEYPHRTRFFAMEPGDYEVFVTSGSLRSETRRVEVDSADGVLYIDLELRRSEAVLRVVNPAGQPVAARVQAGFRVLQPSVIGIYALEGAGEGERVRVSADGYVPVCRFFHAADLEVILSQPTQTATIQLRGDAIPQILWIGGPPIGECPVPLTDFPHRAADASSVSVELHPGDYVVHLFGSDPMPLRVPGPAVVVGQ